jgi:uncharacterized integral membrane protein
MATNEETTPNAVTDPNVFPPTADKGVVATRDHAALAEDEAEADKKYRSVGVFWSVILGFLIALAVIIFLAQNTQTVEVNFLWMTGSAALAVLVLVVAFAAVVVDELAGVVLRSRQRRVKNEREELRRLRNTRAS